MHEDRIMRRNNEYNPNDYHDPHEWPAAHSSPVTMPADALEVLLMAAAISYKSAMQARREHKPYALDEHTLIALHIAIDTAARELGVEEQPLYRDIVRR